jgi:hypothetical protein
MDRATVNPPTPESKIPIGRVPTISPVLTGALLPVAPLCEPDAEVMIIRE